MVLRDDGLEVIGERPRLLGVAVGDVGDEVDEVVERFGRLSRRRRGRHEEDLALGLVLIPLPPEVVNVGLRVAADLVLQTRAGGEMG